MSELKLMNVKLAVAMSSDGCYFVCGNTFEDDERTMLHCVAGLELTGRVSEKQFYVEVAIPEEVIVRGIVKPLPPPLREGE